MPRIELEFALGAERTRVRARLHVERNGGHDRPLILNAEALELIEAGLDGAPVTLPS